MAYFVVVLASVLVGAGAYLATVRLSREEAVSVGPDRETTSPDEVHTEPAGEPGYTYLRVPTTGPTSRDRAQGVVELLALLFVASAALAFGVYQLGHLINMTIERFLAQ